MSIVAQVQTLLNDSGVFWPTAQVLNAINEAQLWAYAQTKWQRTSWQLSLATGTDLLTLPSNVLVPGWIETAVVNNGQTQNMRGFPSTQRELERFLRTWRSAGLDAPNYFIIWDASTIRLFPRPDQPYTYTLWGISYPTEILNATTSLAGPPQYVLAVQNMAAALLFEATRPDLADVYLATAEAQLLDFKKRLRNQQSHNIRRLVPGGRFALQQAGTIRELPTYYPLET